tara:strand:+ start:7613 stop:7825 length:213 start_codon:yes stop_codon:yes gene_type:complete
MEEKRPDEMEMAEKKDEKREEKKDEEIIKVPFLYFSCIILKYLIKASDGDRTHDLQLSEVRKSDFTRFGF